MPMAISFRCEMSSWSLIDGEILCLLGPSGCGKTTLLRIIAGLETEYDGCVTLDGADIGPVPAHKRRFGLMFQDYALFPHLSVADNIAYGLKRMGARPQTYRRQSAVAHGAGRLGRLG